MPECSKLSFRLSGLEFHWFAFLKTEILSFQLEGRERNGPGLSFFHREEVDYCSPFRLIPRHLLRYLTLCIADTGQIANALREHLQRRIKKANRCVFIADKQSGIQQVLREGRGEKVVDSMWADPISICYEPRHKREPIMTINDRTICVSGLESDSRFWNARFRIQADLLSMISSRYIANTCSPNNSKTR
jgi:hypothetical protein